jgi:ABC-type multidrug transport system ATPase subunit
VRIERGERVALVGPSGSGKTTLLALLAGERSSDDARAVLHYAEGVRVLTIDQTWRGLDPERSPRQTLHDWVSDVRAASLLALVGVERGAWDRPAATLSGGERARASLALLVAREADLILLDEPTNDLDLPAIEQLEATLQGASAAIVVATHDERLISALDADVWALEGGGLVAYRGGVAGYRRGARRLEPELDRSDADAFPLVAEKVGDATGGAPADALVAPAQATETGHDTDRTLDAERAEVEAALLDPTRWSDRELDRWRARRRELEARLVEAWDARALPPAPPYRTRESGQRVWAEPTPGGLRVWLDDGPELRVRCSGAIGHLVPERRSDREPLPWAWRALCVGAARLAHYVLPVEAVQVATPVDLGGDVFEPLSPGWWVARRADLERREGWAAHPLPSPLASSPPRRRRRSRRRASTGSVG